MNYTYCTVTYTFVPCNYYIDFEGMETSEVVEIKARLLQSLGNTKIDRKIYIQVCLDLNINITAITKNTGKCRFLLLNYDYANMKPWKTGTTDNGTTIGEVGCIVTVTSPKAVKTVI
jgi:hypothetical protein